ncbi:putative efflux transporter [Desarmillaria ectypa]|nr:putative efflux transporter [Desarmillaria ectypa]
MFILWSVLIVASGTLAMMVNNANQTSISITLLTMAVDLGVPESELTWVVSAYPLSMVTDLCGHKKVFCFGALWLAVFTLGVSFASGIGAATTIPASACLRILAHAFPQSCACMIAFATFAAGVLISRAIGTVISDNQCIDIVGMFLVTAGLVLIIFILIQEELAPQQWKTPYIIVLLITGVIFTLYYQNYEEHTLILTAICLISQSVSGLICNFIVAFVAGQVPFIYFMIITFGFPVAVLSVIGANFVFAAGTLFIVKVSLPHEQSVADTLSTFFGVILFTIVYDRVLQTWAEDFRTDSLNMPKLAQLDAY